MAFIIFIILNLIFHYSASSAPHKPAMVMKLIHVDSIHSPFYNPNTTVKERAENDLQRSSLRFKSSYVQKDSIQIPIGGSFNATERILGVYFAKLYVGTPPIAVFVIIDTGSSVPWVFSSFSYSERQDFYNPVKSKTRNLIYCREEICRNTPYAYQCPEDVPDPICNFRVGYADGSRRMASLVREFFSFDNSDHTWSTIFGSVPEYDHVNPKYHGVLGLGVGSRSVLSQWGADHFHYCLNNISDIYDSTSALVIGGDIISGDGYSETPLVIEQGITKYRVAMQGIIVGKRRLPTLNMPILMYLDSGAALTYLPIDILALIEEQVVEILDQRLRRVSNSQNRLCYAGQITRDLIDFPKIVLKFTSNADFQLLAENSFREIYDGVFCLAFSPPEAEGLNILGAIAQQHHDMRYDLVNNALKFKYLSCSTLDPHSPQSNGQSCRHLRLHSWFVMCLLRFLMCFAF